MTGTEGKINPEREKQERAKKLRYKKSVAEGFNLEGIKDELYEIEEACDNVRYWMEGDEAALIDALDGDEEEAYEVRMLFFDLAAEADMLADILDRGDYVDCFDDLFAAVAHGSVQLIGFDTYETDYFHMANYMQEMGAAEAEKRVMRLAKKELLFAAQQCFGVAAAILNIRYKYDYLQASFDILKDRNGGFLQAIKGVEDAYNTADKAEWYWNDKAVKDFERLVDALPGKVWVE